MAPLLILGVVVLVLAVAALAVVRRRSSAASAAAPSDQELLAKVVLVPAGPQYGLARPPGPDYAPQPVFGMPAAPAAAAAPPAYQPHRPVVTSPTTVRVPSAGGGAHRRESDAAEIARLRALHESGALSDDEFASLSGRLA